MLSEYNKILFFDGQYRCTSHVKISPSPVNLENVLLQQYPVRRGHASALTVSVQ